LPHIDQLSPGETLAKLHLKFNVSPFFTLYSSPDRLNSNWTIANISQSGLGLPDRDYYFDEDKADIRDKYRQYIANVFKQLGISGYKPFQFNNPDDYQTIADRVFGLESKLAKSHLTRTQKRDPKVTYNKFSLAALDRLCSPPLDWGRYLAFGSNPKSGEFLWKDYFHHLTPQPLGDLNLSTVDAITTAIEIINTSSLDELVPYLIFQVLTRYSPHLSTDFIQLHFEFYEKVLKGTQELKPRWKRVLETLEEALGDALGQKYVQKYFSAEAKSYALQIVKEIQEALRDRLREVSWMSEETRLEALKKMESFRVKIGYPVSRVTNEPVTDRRFSLNGLITRILNFMKLHTLRTLPWRESCSIVLILLA
jgi:putative endopeptidase